MLKNIREKLNGAELFKNENIISKTHENGYGELDITTSFTVCNRMFSLSIIYPDKNIENRRLVHGAIKTNCNSLYPYAWTEDNINSLVFDPITLKHYDKEIFYQKLELKKFIDLTVEEFALMYYRKSADYFIAYPEAFHKVYYKKTNLWIEEIPDHAELFDFEEYIEQKLTFSPEDEPMNLKDFINFDILKKEFLHVYIEHEKLHKKGAISNKAFSNTKSFARAIFSGCLI
jgi:hypothetical protein